MPQQVVKSRFLKLNSSHIEYVLEAMNKNPSDIRNIRAYLLTALYIDELFAQGIRVAVLTNHNIYAGYRASGYSKAYYEEHEDAIKLCKASKRAFDELLPSDTSGKTAGSHKKQLPSMKALRAE